jgi:alanine racemase
VAGIDEAVNLLDTGIRKEIHLLSGFHQAEELPLVSERGLVPAIHTWRQLELLEAAILPKPITVCLKFDSGMHRLGFRRSEVTQAARRLSRMAQVRQVRLMSHLACADDLGSTYTDYQADLFETACRPYDWPASLANSAGICGWPRTHADWVRPGIMLYGCTPLLDRDEAALGLIPVMSLHSEIIAIHHLKKGDLLGYGGAWRCPEDMPVGVVACGYGDGYPRHAPSGTPVWIRGQRAGLAGRVSMDMLSVDLRQIRRAEIGDEVELWGEQVLASEVAKLAHTISYELLTGVTSRVHRRLEAGLG